MRSLLFVPGHDARKLARALDSGADALILDLEDAVPPAAKDEARAGCADFVARHRDRLALWVRINALDTPHALADLAAVARAGPRGIMLPKCGGAADVQAVSRYLDILEVREGLPQGSLRLLPIVTETAAATLRAAQYEAGGRLEGLMWGGEDLAADLGAQANRDASGRYTAPYEMARSLALLGAAAARVPAIDAVYPNFRDPQGLRAEALDALRDGFSAKAAIHPAQVAVINEAFTPAPQTVQQAERVLRAFAEAGGAAVVALDGMMLDRPHYRAARRVLERAALAGKA